MDKLGIAVGQVWWTGFWSQGDGASFEGAVYDQCILTLLPHLKVETPVLASTLREERYVSWRITASGCYSHEMTMQIENCSQGMYPIPHDDPLLQRIYEHRAELLLKELDLVTDAILEFCREKARELYSNLEKEYDYQTDEAQVIETCANLGIGLDYLKELEDERDEC